MGIKRDGWESDLIGNVIEQRMGAYGTAIACGYFLLVFLADGSGAFFLAMNLFIASLDS